MWILILILSITTNCIITFVSIRQMQEAIINEWKMQEKQNKIFTQNIFEIYKKMEGETKDEQTRSKGL